MSASRTTGLFRCILLLALAWFCASRAAAQTTLVASGVDRMARGSNALAYESPPRLFDPVVYYYVAPTCTTGAPNHLLPAKIVRSPNYIATQRDVFVFNPPRAAGACNPFQMLSNVVADSTHVYWIDNQSSLGTIPTLKKLSRSANPGDAPIELKYVPDATPSFPHEIVSAGDRLYLIIARATLADFVTRIDKNLPDGGPLPELVYASVSDMRALQWDGRWLWWLESATLRRWDSTSGNVQTIDTGVSAYLSEGDFSDCSPLGCQYANIVWLAKGNQLFSRNTFLAGAPSLEYTSPRATAGIREIIRDQFYVFFFETTPVGMFLDLENRLFRKPIGSGSAALIYGPARTALTGPEGLSTDLTTLVWRNTRRGPLLALPNNAAAIPIYDAVARGIEVTQGLQDRAHSVRLIQGKRTLVRFYVESGDARDIPGVGATLSGSNQTSGSLGTLEPINSVGKLLTVKPYFKNKRERIDDGFVFELPAHWTTGGPLTLVASVNPWAKILEDDQDDNHSLLGSIQFAASPRLSVQYLDFIYPLNGNLVFAPSAEVWESQRFMRRLYPLGQLPVFTGPGLHFTRSDVVDLGLGAHVARTHPDCVKRYKKAEDRNMCASDVAHARVAEMGRRGELVPNSAYYVNLPQAPVPATLPAGSYFTRGYASGAIGSGPSTDRNYAAHEIGHVLGRQHPDMFASVCGHSASDPYYPHVYYTSHFGSEETRVSGIDFPDLISGGKIEFIRYDRAHDTMSYCSPNWISDYTQDGIYDFLMTSAPGSANGAGGPGAAPTSGDWLFVAGVVGGDPLTGEILRAARLDEIADSSPPDPGGAAELQLVDAAGEVLASHAFALEAREEAPGRSGFELVVPFAAGTTGIRIVDVATQAELATREVSASAPVVSDVQLVAAPDPVDGPVSVEWTASDADGDALAYDLLASRDGGQTWRTIVAGIESAPFELDSGLLGGGSNQLRILASDGVQTAHAQSAPFEVAPRAPRPGILSPPDGFRADWSQLVAFEAEASDLQDLVVDESGFVWSTPYGVIGTGRMVQSDALPVGTYPVTLTVTNSLGAAASTSIELSVGDPLTDPGPTLSVIPQAIEWHVENTETLTQLAALEVVNAGGGALGFDLSSDQPWLTVDAAPGVSGAAAPRSFAISADPSLVPPGATSTATLTIQSLSNPEDVVRVPVTLSKGNVFDHTGSVDLDGDGSPDLSDNCPALANADQADADLDLLGDACDNCPHYATGDTADTDADGRGDACECSDQTGDGRNTVADLVAINLAIFDPARATELCDGNGDGACNVGDIVAANLEIFSPGNTSTCARQPVPGP